jgi:hypothetical protein
MSVGLEKVAQVFQVAIQKHAIAVVGRQVGIELRQIDAGHQRAVLGKRLREHRDARIPPLRAGQQQQEALRRTRRRIDCQVLEASIAQMVGGLGGHRRRRGSSLGCGGGTVANPGADGHANDGGGNESAADNGVLHSDEVYTA